MYKKLTKFHLLALFTISCLAQRNFAQESNQNPNVILILVDDLGYGDVSAYNENAAFATVNIDRLAKEGISFTDAHTSSAVCSPTRYGIITGRYSWRSKLKHGVLKGYSKPIINNERKTIAELFKENGYSTGMIGKWHLGWDWQFVGNPNIKNNDIEAPETDFNKPILNGPNTHGFEYFYGISASLSSPPYVYIENNLATSIPKDSSVNYDEKAFWRKGPVAPDFNHIEVLPNLGDKTVEYIKDQAKSDKPFFLYCALTAPHAPIIPSTEFIGKSKTNAFGDFVLMVDHVVGKITEAVREEESLKNTIVIFTSDNGQSPRADFRGDELSKAGHNGSYIFRGQKSDIYEGGHRVPFIVKWPGKINEGGISNETICTIDLMATASELVNVKLPDTAGEDSYSILPILKGESYNKPLREATVHHSGTGRFAIRKEEWKLILWPGSGGWSSPSTEEEMQGLPEFQLYNLKEDPTEKKNLVAEHPQKVKELQSLLEKYITQGRSTPGIPQKNDGPEKWAELEWMFK
ncbi:arylsulfatase [Maribacter sp. Asnod2-G09]|uniref:sulfatase family protein n=1 Tax=Maribacter sp. Asnod2-G09 TaxID=3160577 RepID=UPI003865F3AE